MFLGTSGRLFYSPGNLYLIQLESMAGQFTYITKFIFKFCRFIFGLQINNQDSPTISGISQFRLTLLVKTAQ
jgi:hypothetical protein